MRAKAFEPSPRIATAATISSAAAITTASTVFLDIASLHLLKEQSMGRVTGLQRIATVRQQP
jgi:hypothetical protein